MNVNVTIGENIGLAIFLLLSGLLCMLVSKAMITVSKGGLFSFRVSDQDSEVVRNNSKILFRVGAVIFLLGLFFAIVFNRSDVVAFLGLLFPPTPTPPDPTNNNTTPNNVIPIPLKITWNNPVDITYGTALNSTQLNANASVPGNFTYTPASGTVLSVGAHTLHVDFTPTGTANYTNVTAKVTINVLKSTPTITWSNPAIITYGTALNSTQLNANASVPGNFTYTPASGTILGTGTQILHVDFTPTDTINYTTTSRDVITKVLKSTPTVTWSNPANITYGTALSGTKLNAKASVPGIYVYNPPIGTVLSAGTHNLHVNFTPTDITNYNTTSKEVTINVLKATPTINWSNPTYITSGTVLSTTQLNAQASVPGTYVYNPPLGQKLLYAGLYTLHVDFTPTDITNYTTKSMDITTKVRR